METIQIRALSDDEIVARDAGLDMAADLIGAPRPLTLAQLQTLYDVLLTETATEEALISLGLAFGEQLILSAPHFEWVRVSDQYGDETCVAVRGKEIFCAPISMVQKRIRRKEQIDLKLMRDGTIATIQSRIDEGKARDR